MSARTAVVPLELLERLEKAIDKLGREPMCERRCGSSCSLCKIDSDHQRGDKELAAPLRRDLQRLIHEASR